MARTTGKTLDPRDAPRGYLAKRAYRFCTGCAFETEEGPVRCSRPELLRCVPSCRADGKSVIFVDARPPGKAFSRWWSGERRHLKKVAPRLLASAPGTLLMVARRGFAAGRRRGVAP